MQVLYEFQNVKKKNVLFFLYFVLWVALAMLTTFSDTLGLNELNENLFVFMMFYLWMWVNGAWW